MIDPITYSNEIFLNVHIEDIKPVYAISNYGKVMNVKSGRILKPYVLNSGYLAIDLCKESGGTQTFLVHRLVMMVHHPIENYRDMQVNHIYGDKFDNYDNHLEWLTGLDNVHHAIKTGLQNNSGENNYRSVLTENQVRTICSGLEQGIPFSDIAECVKDAKCINIKKEINQIFKHRNWKHISKNYKFAEYPINRRFTDDQVHKICTMIECGLSNSDILSNLGFEFENESVKHSYIGTISNIRSRKYYKNISKDYNF